MRGAVTSQAVLAGVPSGPMRLPQVGQSLRSFWDSCATPRAEAEVLDRPRQLRVRGRERQHLADDLELLAGVAVEVDLLGLGLDDDLAARRGVAQAVALSGAHGGHSTEGGGRPSRLAPGARRPSGAGIG